MYLLRADFFWTGGKYTGKVVFLDGSNYVPVATQKLDNWCHQIKDNNKVDGWNCGNIFPYICQITTSMVTLNFQPLTTISIWRSRYFWSSVSSCCQAMFSSGIPEVIGTTSLKGLFLWNNDGTWRQGFFIPLPPDSLNFYHCNVWRIKWKRNSKSNSPSTINITGVFVAG